MGGMQEAAAEVLAETAEVSSEEASVEDSNSTEVSSEEADAGVTKEAEVEAEGDSEESEGSEEESAESFLDSVNPDELPEELKGFYKKMQADYTRKTSELAAAKKKAQLYDELQEKNLVQERVGDPKQEAAVKQAVENELARQMGVDYKSLSPAEQQQYDALSTAMQKIAQEAVEGAIKPIESNLRQQEYEQELKEVRAKYSDFNDHLEDIQAILTNNPGYSFEDAYKLAAFEAREKVGEERGRQAALEELKKKKSQAPLKSKTTGKEAKTEEDEIPRGASIRDIIKSLAS